MRRRVNLERLQQFMIALSDGIRHSTRIYLVGGVSAVIFGWRDSTLDIDLKIEPYADEVLRLIPKLKEKLELNVELAAPDDFVPPLPGWRERSVYIERVGKLDFFHYDFYSQALAKIERDHKLDRSDVSEMIEQGLVKRDELLRLFNLIEGELYKYPAVNPLRLRSKVNEIATAI